MRALLIVMALAAVAHAGDAPFPDLPKAVVLVKDVTATSTFADKKAAYAPWHAVAYETRGGPDMMNPLAVPILWSAWCEGKADEGIGETLTISLAEPTQIDAIKLATGVWRTDALWKANNQPTALELSLDGAKPIAVAPKGKTWTTVKIGAKVSTIAIKITAVKKGKMNDSCIAGIDFVRGDATLAPLVGIDAKAWAALPKTIAAIQKALESDTRKGLEALLEFPFSSHDLMGDFGGYGGSKTATDASWKELVAACAVFDKARKAKGEDFDWIDPLGCPQATNYDPTDSRGDVVTTSSPGVVFVMFPSHKEAGIRWRLHWTDRWRLTDIDES